MRRHLLPGEQVLLSTRRHAGALLGPVLVAFAVVALCALAGLLLTPESTTDPLDLSLGAVAGLALTWLLSRIWRWSVVRLVLTDERLIEMRGRVWRGVSSMPLTKLVDVSVRRTLPGRLLGYGSVTVISADGGVRRFERLPHPARVYRTILEALLNPPEATRHAEFWDTDDWTPSEWAPEDEADTGPLPVVGG
ncbi:MAG: PH domain-containing protein [Actinomycetota bacterium]